MKLDRKSLLAKQKLAIKKVDLDNGDFVYVKEMTGHERDTFEGSLLKAIKDRKGTIVNYEPSNDDFRSKLTVFTVCDEKGTLLLEAKDWKTLGSNISATQLGKIADAASKLNAITPEDVEEMVKN